VYYYAYDDEGQRLGPWTTGQSNKTAARNYCNLLNRKGKLMPGPNEVPAFAEFATVFWDWVKSPYLKERRKRRELTQSYADSNKRITEYTLVPHFGKMKLDKFLVSAGADVNTQNNIFPPLHVAVGTGNIEITKLLVSAGANVVMKNNMGDTPLHAAVISENVEIVKYLLSARAFVNAKNNNGDTPLHAAAMIGNVEIADLLSGF
jgi:ankyrin repeat protein